MQIFFRFRFFKDRCKWESNFCQIAKTVSRILQVLTSTPPSSNTSTPLFASHPLKRLPNTVSNTLFPFVSASGRPPCIPICSQNFLWGFCDVARSIFQNSALHPNFDIHHVGTFLVIYLPWHHYKFLQNYSPTTYNCISDGRLSIQPRQNKLEASRDSREFQFDSSVGVKNIHTHSCLLPKWHATSEASLRHNQLR